jgi:hypothetical protein
MLTQFGTNGEFLPRRSMTVRGSSPPVGHAMTGRSASTLLSRLNDTPNAEYGLVDNGLERVDARMQISPVMCAQRSTVLPGDADPGGWRVAWLLTAPMAS